MWIRKQIFYTFTALLFSFSSLYAGENLEVVVYATGGTIAGSSTSSTDTTDYSAGEIGVSTLIAAVPEIQRIAKVSGVQISNTGSNNLTQDIVLKLSKEINFKLDNSDICGAVVTHGTDTLEETAFFLDLTVDSPKPVVVVGAMRPATAVSADGNMNLLEAVRLAVEPDAMNRGTMIVLNDRIGSAFYTTKTNSTMLDTFKASEQGYIGAFISGEPFFYYQSTKPVNKHLFDISTTDKLPLVKILYSYQDQDSTLLEAAIAHGAKGIVIAGTGNGSIPKIMDDAVNKAMAAGIPVVRSTRTGSGYVSPKSVGIGAGFFNPQKSKILLELALNAGANMAEIRSYFEGK